MRREADSMRRQKNMARSAARKQAGLNLQPLGKFFSGISGAFSRYKQGLQSGAGRAKQYVKETGQFPG